MVQLYNVDSPINREQRNNINATFADIQNRLSNLRYQISLLSGGADLDEVIQQIDTAVNSANTASQNAQGIADQVSSLLPVLEQNIQDSNQVISDGNTTINNLNTLNSELIDLRDALLSLQSQLNDITASEAERVSNENTRVASENSRESAEDTRIANENSRIVAEQLRENNNQQILDIIENIESFNYEPTVTYNFPNFVTYNGSSYIALQEVTGVTPNNDGLNYRLVAQRGVDGNGAVSSVNEQLPDINGNVTLQVPTIQEFEQLETNLSEFIERYETTSDLNYYVDVQNGSDSNDGLTSSSAFASLQYAIDQLPRMINNQITINIAEGSYNEEVFISGFTGSGTLTITGGNQISQNKSFNFFEINQCPMSINLNGLSVINTARENGFVVSRCNSVYINHCFSNRGYLFADSKASIRNSEANISINGGITLIENSLVIAENLTGIGNLYSAVVNASVLYTNGVLPNNNSEPVLVNGGFVANNVASTIQESEINAVLQNGWVNYDDVTLASYYKDTIGTVRLSGRIKDGTVGSVAAFTLPLGYRPKNQKMFVVANGVQIYIIPEGVVSVFSGPNADVWLDGVEFRAGG